MNRKNMGLLSLVIIILLFVITVLSIFSFDTSHAYDIVNQYGDVVKIWGAGVYTHDSYFKSPIFIGSDFTILVLVVPLYISTSIKLYKVESPQNYVCNLGVLGIILYYSASLAFGVTYNYLHLLYICLFGFSLFFSAYHFMRLYSFTARGEELCQFNCTKGMRIFLVIAGVSLFVAWLPDILSSIFQGTTLAIIEVYTTEITYVLDMGIISPLCFLTLYLAKQKNFAGYVWLRMILKLCMIIGIMLPIQSIFQMAAGITIPLPAFISKVFIFVLMAVFACYFELRLKRDTRFINVNV